ncbi:hypothetical protein SAMN04488029_1386 [Reichenbachiella faecimaris]|uniref:Uncharacterized protein n=1 Tax=Reichenbachiella faecimaris TaxID=692418 RepID=A0A1W2G8S1_REIFA|nr:hypothetical protein [Reichenbachiella faecimaris]SMD33023.1 hypothetical protein SAMN04488029_1386 [Reichenbachiella faecimaris]
MKNILNILCIAWLATTIVACNSGKKSEEADKATLENVKEKVEKEFEYPIPTSFEVTELLQDAGAAFVWNITNPSENVDKYETQRDKALNLGIYGADLSYACTYNSQEETMQMLKASKVLIDGLEIPGIFDDEMVARVEKNLDNKDSLILIVTKSFYNTYTELNKAGQDKMSFLVVAGSWIEGLYITCQLAISSDYDPRMLNIVAEQKKSAIKLAEFASQYADDADIESVRPLLEFMKIIYEGIDPATGITKGQLDDISSNVESTRDDIIG